MPEIFKLQAVVDVATGNATRVLKDIDGAGQQLAKSLGTTAEKAKFAGAALAAAAAAGAAALSFAVASASEFERAMRNVNTIAGLTETKFKEFSDKVRGLGQEMGLGIAPARVAAAAYDIMSSGFTDAKEATDVLRASLLAATAGLSDAKDAAAAITAVMNSYGKETMSAMEVSDKMFEAVKAGVFTFEDLSHHIGDVASMAASAGVSFDELSGVLAALTVKGVRLPVAVTSIRAALLQLTAPTEEAKLAMREYGLTIDENTVKQKGLVATLAELTTKTGGNKEAMRRILGDVAAVSAVTALMKDGGKAAADAIDQISKSGGATMRAKEEQAKSLAFAWEQFSASVKTVATEIGTTFLPAAREMLNIGKTLMETYGPAAWHERAEAARKFFGVFPDKTPKLEAAANDAASVMGKYRFVLGKTAQQLMAAGKSSQDVAKFIESFSEKLGTTREMLLTERNKGNPRDREEELLSAPGTFRDPEKVKRFQGELARGSAQLQKLREVQAEMRRDEADASRYQEASRLHADAQAKKVDAARKAFKEFTLLRDQEGFASKKAELEAFDRFFSTRKAEVRASEEASNTRRKLVREATAEIAQVEEKADAENARANAEDAKLDVQMERSRYEEKKRLGEATMEDLRRIRKLEISEAREVRAQKMTIIDNEEADLARRGLLNETAQSAIRARRTVAEHEHTLTLRGIYQSRYEAEKAELLRSLNFAKQTIESRRAMNDIELQRLNILEGRGFNVEEKMRAAQQQRLDDALKLNAQERDIALQGEGLAEERARITERYTAKEREIRARFFIEEADRQFRQAEAQRKFHEGVADDVFRLTHDSTEVEVREFNRRIEELRKQGASEVEIAELVAAKKKKMLDDEEAALKKVGEVRAQQAGLGKAFQGAQSLEEAFGGKASLRFELGFGSEEEAKAAARRQAIEGLGRPVKPGKFSPGGLFGPSPITANRREFSPEASPEPFPSRNLNRTESVDVRLHMDGNVEVRKGPLSANTVRGIYDDLGIEARLEGTTSAGIGRT